MSKNKTDHAQEERARLEAIPPRIRTGAGELTAKLNAHKRAVAELEQRRAKLRHQWVTEGETAAIKKEIDAVTARLAEAPQEQARIEGLLQVGVQALRENRDERNQLLRDELDAFLHGAVKLSLEAESKLRALAPAVQEALRAYTAAAREWTALTDAVTARLKERDMAAGFNRPDSHYSDVVKFPAFPVAALGASIRPEAENLLSKAPQQPAQMKRVA